MTDEYTALGSVVEPHAAGRANAAAAQPRVDKPGRKVGFGESALRSLGQGFIEAGAALPFIAAAVPTDIANRLDTARESIGWLQRHHVPGAGYLAPVSDALGHGRDLASGVADRLFGASDELRQQGEDFYGPKAGEQFDHLGQLVGSLPVQMSTMALQSAVHGQQLINQGVPAEAVQRAVLGDTAFNVATAPLRGIGPNRAVRALTGAALGGATSAAQRWLEKQELGDDAPRDVREAPLWSRDDAFASLLGAGFGATHAAPRAGARARAPEGEAQAGPASPEAKSQAPSAGSTSSATESSDARAPVPSPPGTGASGGAEGASTGLRDVPRPYPALAADEHAHGEAAAGVAPGTLHPDDLAATTHLVLTDPASAMRLHAQHPDNEAAFNAAVQERLHANEESRQVSGQTAEQAGGADARGAGDRGAAAQAGAAGEPAKPGAPASALGRVTGPSPVTPGEPPPPRAKAQRPWIVTDHDVPLAGGRDAPGPQPRRTYIDRGIPEWVHVPEAGKWVNAWEEIDQHERAEEPHLDQYGYGHSGDAHDRFGNLATNEYLQRQGVKPADYARALQPHVDAARARAEDGAAGQLPPDLDRRPYEGNGDAQLLDDPGVGGERRRQPAPRTAERAGGDVGPPDPPPETTLPEPPRAPVPGARSFQGEEMWPGKLLGSIDTVTVPKAYDSGHEVRHAGSGRVIAEGRDAGEANARALDLARDLGRRRIEQRFGAEGRPLESATQNSMLPGRSQAEWRSDGGESDELQLLPTDGGGSQSGGVGASASGLSRRGPPADDGFHESAGEASRAPGNGGSGVSGGAKNLLGSIVAQTVRSASGLGYEVIHPDTEVVISRGKTAAQTWAKAKKEAQRLGRKRLLAQLQAHANEPTGTRVGEENASAPAPSERLVKTGDVEEFIKGLKSKPTPAHRPCDLFEIEQTGPLNHLVVGSKTKFWIDGYKGRTILDTKFVDLPERSPYLHGSDAPSFVREGTLLQEAKQFKSLAEILIDPKVAFNSVDVLVNDARAAPYFESLMQQFNIPGRVRVVDTKIKQRRR